MHVPQTFFGKVPTAAITSDSSGAIEFLRSAIGRDFSTSTLSDIVSDVEALLENTDSSTNLNGESSQLTEGGVNTDSLLVFYEAGSQGATQDAVIIRYQEGSTSEADFYGELAVFAVLESVTNIDDAIFI